MGYNICDYYIFHDVDALPLSTENTYQFSDHLEHMCTFWGQSNVKFHDNVGGVLKMNREKFIDIGGFSNGYWGWGLEDNDMYLRILRSPYALEKYDTTKGHYEKIDHKRFDYNTWLESKQCKQSREYYLQAENGEIYFKKEGISSIDATILDIIDDSIDLRHFVVRINNRLNLIHTSMYDFQ